MRKREYKSGSNWAFWRWTFTPSNYITRLHIIKTPWWAIMIHWINGPDPEPDMHDHPVTFLSIILRGGYTEDVLMTENFGDFLGGWPVIRRINRRWFNFIRAGKHVHSIQWVAPETVTLCFVGPKVREWGFHTKDGWVHWKEYNRKYNQ
jgi:hypothetical protein